MPCKFYALDICWPELKLLICVRYAIADCHFLQKTPDILKSNCVLVEDRNMPMNVGEVHRLLIIRAAAEIK